MADFDLSPEVLQLRDSYRRSTNIIGRTCQNERLVTLARMMGGSYTHHRHEGLKQFGRCTRPVWGDGKVNGREYDLCALCWHNWCANYGPYRLISLNAAAAYVDVKAAATLDALFIESKVDPRKVAAIPASFLEVMWGDEPMPEWVEEYE